MKNRFGCLLVVALMMALCQTVVAAAPAKVNGPMAQPLLPEEKLQAIKACGLSNGQTGSHLPEVVRDALKVLPSFLDTGWKPQEDQVIYLKTIGPFEKCLSDNGFVASNLEQGYMFTIGLSLPVFVRGDVFPIMNSYNPNTGMVFLKYVMATKLGHEVGHLMYGTTGDQAPQTYEKTLLEAFYKDGKIPQTVYQDCANALTRSLAAAKKAADERWARDNADAIVQK